jgi:hypothetical protein
VYEKVLLPALSLSKGLSRHSLGDGGSHQPKAQSRCSVTGLFREWATRKGGEGEKTTEYLEENPTSLTSVQMERF